MASEPITFQRAAWMRRHLTPPEARLWRYLKGGNLGAKFRRQHPIGPYILDFYCPRAKLAVEVDGAVHGSEEQMRHDARRRAWLEAKGVTTLRYPATAIRENLDGVLAAIREAVQPR